jgi:hypothetical protein
MMNDEAHGFGKGTSGTHINPRFEIRCAAEVMLIVISKIPNSKILYIVLLSLAMVLLQKVQLLSHACRQR